MGVSLEIHHPPILLSPSQQRGIAPRLETMAQRHPTGSSQKEASSGLADVFPSVSQLPKHAKDAKDAKAAASARGRWR